MADPLFGPEVRLLLQENDTAGMKAFCESLHPAAVAEALEGFTAEEVWKVLEHTSIKNQAAIFEYYPLEFQVEMVQGAGREHIAKLIEQMSPDDRADLLRRLMPRVAEALLRLVDEADRRDIAQLVKYAENTAGAMMTTDYAWVPAHITVNEAIDRLRQQAPDKETIYYVFVLDEQRRLQGVVTLRELILAPRYQHIKDIMERSPIKVNVNDDREKVAQELARYDLLAIPVVDNEDRLVGIVTHDDAIDVVVEEATEDVHRMGGVGTMEENYLEASFVTVWRKRAIWLACLFGAELFTFTALASYEDSIKTMVVLSLFVPLCISTGGNSGSQAATLITRAMALGQVQQREWWKVLKHELLMGIILGLTLGVIGYVRAAATPHSVLADEETLHGPLQVRLPKEKPPLELQANGAITVPEQVEHSRWQTSKRRMEVVPPTGTTWQPKEEGNTRVYEFAPGTVLRMEAVSRWDLALVIAQAVMLICLWGTLLGAMLPLVFRALGFDPAFASSPFVATFVDVTGIMIYFNVAQMWLPGLS
jgi:magnesium transporter